MQLITKTPFESSVDLLVETIGQATQNNKRVLWLVSGGSAVKVAAEVSHRLPASHDVHILQVDERYGLPGHPDANWRLLREAGLETDKFTCEPMLGDYDFETIVHDYALLLGAELVAADVTVGLFGIGEDGHTAGLLPGSSALESDKLIAGFQGPDFQRITMTAKAIARLDLTVTYVTGANKLPALQDLMKDIPFKEQPAQVLKMAKQAIIFNDQVEGEV